MQQKLFLFDGMSLIYRAHFALSKNPRISSKGTNTSAILVFFNILLQVLDKMEPTHICVAFDTKKTTIRHEIFKEYKSNRLDIPEDIVVAIKYIKDILSKMDISIVQKPGYEADDIIGTLAQQAAKQGFKTYIMTPDKDFAQLVSENIFIYKPAVGVNKSVEIIDEKSILANWQVLPYQVPDVLGLWGDASDNIPGVPGIGEKTAKKLISEYGSIQNIIDNIDQLKGKLHENIKKFQDQALLSKQLATIIKDVDINCDIEAFKIKPIKEIDKLREIFKELEFKTLANRILNEESKSQVSLFAEIDTQQDKAIQNISTNITRIDNHKELGTLFHKLTNIKELSITAKIIDHLLSLGISYDSNTSYLISIDTSLEESKEILKRLKNILEQEDTIKISYDIKELIPLFRSIDIDFKPKYFDIMIAHYLIDSESNRSLINIAKTYLDIDLDEYIEQPECLAEIAGINIKLKEKFNRILIESALINLAEKIEFPLIYVLAEIERAGIKIDLEALREYDESLIKDLKDITQEIYDMSGLEFNLSSPKQLGEVLFNKIIPNDKAFKTKTGQYKTDETTLQALIKEHQIIPKILEYRSLSKLKNTYVDAFKKLVRKDKNTLHTTFNQALVSTGRLSSTNPNLQNIPIKTERGHNIRKIFVPSSQQYILLSADYSQIELRLLAHIANEKNMINAFNNNEDIHISTASKIFGVSLDKVTIEQRRIAKTVNFGIVYGQSAFGLSQTLGITRKEAKTIIEEYFNNYPGIKDYMHTSIQKAREKGFTETLLGRRRYLRDISSANAVMRAISERNAINSPIQGTAADIIKIAMINIYYELKMRQLKSNLVLQVHDELLVDVPQNEVSVVQPIVINLMQDVIKLQIQLKVNCKISNNWLGV
ncbi:MAG: DNA polymerase I [Solitalea-like symbiont of Tyrophagus putrescentiae]